MLYLIKFIERNWVWSCWSWVIITFFVLRGVLKEYSPVLTTGSPLEAWGFLSTMLMSIVIGGILNFFLIGFWTLILATYKELKKK